MNIYLREVTYSLKTVGFLTTIRHIAGALIDRSFDIRYGTRTAGWESLGKIEIDSSNKKRGVDYHPSRAKPLERLLGRLAIPKNYGFVDFGCGKGRVLLLALKYGFTTVRGIEFAQSLCEIARNNVKIFRKRTGLKGKAEVVCEDVVFYRIRPDEHIFYLFNPFDEEVLRKVIKNIEVSYTKKPRRLWLIYFNPVNHRIIEETAQFLTYKTIHKIGVCTFYVYETV
jgi:SAM-dependent methyltransferase